MMMMMQERELKRGRGIVVYPYASGVAWSKVKCKACRTGGGPKDPNSKGRGVDAPNFQRLAYSTGEKLSSKVGEGVLLGGPATSGPLDPNFLESDVPI
jgi:hypothetical protein